MVALSLLRVGALGLMASLAVACVVENSSRGGGGAGSPESVGGTPGTPAGTPPKVTPLLVRVDPNVTMTANPGDGVGVFTEYSTGGHWHVWWTCDTNRTDQSCAFDVKITPSKGALTNAKSDAFVSNDDLTTAPAAIEATTTTSTNVEGVYFDTDPGVIITLDASVGGLEDGSFLFFVQDGKVNGGYTGKLTDPLELQGSSP